MRFTVIFGGPAEASKNTAWVKLQKISKKWKQKLDSTSIQKTPVLHSTAISLARGRPWMPWKPTSNTYESKLLAPKMLASYNIRTYTYVLFHHDTILSYCRCIQKCVINIANIYKQMQAFWKSQVSWFDQYSNYSFKFSAELATSRQQRSLQPHWYLKNMSAWLDKEHIPLKNNLVNLQLPV